MEPINSLNSCLLEGEVCTDPEIQRGPGGHGAVCLFSVESHKWIKADDCTSRENYRIDVQTIPGRLADSCYKNLQIGRRVRLVGRIAEKAGAVFIIAEHVELTIHVTEPAEATT